MRRAHDDVTAFHRLVGATIGDVAKPDATVDLELRVKLIAEEFDELLCALSPDSPAPQITETVKEWLFERRHWIETRADVTPDLPDVADALADLAYVTVGASVTWGIPGAAVWSEVHSANMRKAGGPKDPQTGKALKPPGWTPPDIEGVLKREADRKSRHRPHQRGDQVAMLMAAPSHLQKPDGPRRILDEHIEGPVWWCYALERGCLPGRRAKVDISCMPEILEPWTIDEYEPCTCQGFYMPTSCPRHGGKR